MIGTTAQEALDTSAGVVVPTTSDIDPALPFKEQKEVLTVKAAVIAMTNEPILEGAGVRARLEDNGSANVMIDPTIAKAHGERIKQQRQA